MQACLAGSPLPRQPDDGPAGEGVSGSIPRLWRYGNPSKVRPEPALRRDMSHRILPPSPRPCCRDGAAPRAVLRLGGADARDVLSIPGRYARGGSMVASETEGRRTYYGYGSPATRPSPDPNPNTHLTPFPANRYYNIGGDEIVQHLTLTGPASFSTLRHHSDSSGNQRSQHPSIPPGTTHSRCLLSPLSIPNSWPMTKRQRTGRGFVWDGGCHRGRRRGPVAGPFIDLHSSLLGETRRREARRARGRSLC